MVPSRGVIAHFLIGPGQVDDIRIRVRQPNGPIFGNAATWQRQFEAAHVHVQWDTERTLRGAPLNHYSLQVGLSRHVIARFVDEWIVAMEDFTPTVAKIYRLVQSGHVAQAQRLLPSERVYPVPQDVAQRLMVG